MKSQLIAILAAVLLVGCGESQQSAPAPETKPVEPVVEVPAQTSPPPVEAKSAEPVAEAAKPTTPLKAVLANKGADPVRGIKPKPPSTKAPDISIHDAAAKGNIEAVKKAIAAGADVNAKGDGGETPLHHATTKAVTELLIAEGADVNAKNAEGWTPLHEAALYGDKEISELLIAKSANVNAKDDDGETPLHKAVYNGHKEVTELLIAAGVDVNAKDKKGKTPVSEAALWGHKEVTELLIAAGADVNAKSADGQTPLHYSARVGGFSTRHKEVAELLIAKGADVNAKRDDGITPLDRAEKLEDYQKRPETKAAKKEIADLLRKHGGKPGETRREELKAERALFNAVFEGNIEAVKKHLDDGVDVNAKYIGGITPVDWAIAGNRSEIADLLRKHGGKTGEELKAEGK